MGEVTDNFLSGLELALSLDGTVKTIAFSDGSGIPGDNLIRKLTVLWLTDAENLARTKSGDFNLLAWSQGIKLVMAAADVPQQAALAANCYLRVDGKQYKIESAFLENEVWQVQLQVFRTSMK
jgi:hypothetical protein